MAKNKVTMDICRFLLAIQLQNDLKIDDGCEVIYNEFSFNLDPINNMATSGHSCFWLVDILKFILENPRSNDF